MVRGVTTVSEFDFICTRYYYLCQFWFLQVFIAYKSKYRSYTLAITWQQNWWLCHGTMKIIPLLFTPNFFLRFLKQRFSTQCNCHRPRKVVYNVHTQVLHECDNQCTCITWVLPWKIRAHPGMHPHFVLCLFLVLLQLPTFAITNPTTGSTVHCWEWKNKD